MEFTRVNTKSLAITKFSFPTLLVASRSTPISMARTQGMGPKTRSNFVSLDLSIVRPNIGLAGCGISIFSLPGFGIKEDLKVGCGMVRSQREAGSSSFSWRDAVNHDISKAGTEMDQTTRR